MTTYSSPPCDVGVLESGEFTEACTPSTGRWVLAATILGSSLAFIDGTAISVALPVLQKDLGASVTQMQWVVEAYALFLAALLLVGGAMGDRIGRKRVFGIGIGLFALASIWGGLAPSAGQLIIGRALQGVGGAMMVPGPAWRSSARRSPTTTVVGLSAHGLGPLPLPRPLGLCWADGWSRIYPGDGCSSSTSPLRSSY